MREIKFRAWDKENKRMVKQKRLRNPKIMSVDLTRVGFKFKKSSFIFMQFTGLKDEDGKDIYEWDIIEWYYGSDNAKKDTFRAKVLWRRTIREHGCEGYQAHHVGFVCEWLTDEGSENMQFTDMPKEENCKIKVIGNIYENPELLEEGKWER